jgi:hypothetical protein
MGPRKLTTECARPAWPGYSARGTLVLPLPACWLAGLPPLLEVDGVVLGRKSEAHLTLLDREAAARIREACPDDEVQALFRAHDWTVLATGERWLLRKTLASGRIAHSLVAIVAAPGLSAFRRDLVAYCGVPLPEALAHVTLYVAGKPTGIGVPDVDAFARLRVRRLDEGESPQSS